MMNEVGNEGQVESGGNSGRSVAITAIIAVAMIILVSILACAATTIIFIYNAPW